MSPLRQCCRRNGLYAKYRRLFFRTKPAVKRPLSKVWLSAPLNGPTPALYTVYRFACCRYLGCIGEGRIIAAVLGDDARSRVIGLVANQPTAHARRHLGIAGTAAAENCPVCADAVDSRRYNSRFTEGVVLVRSAIPPSFGRAGRCNFLASRDTYPL